jgi:DNA-binding NtrC family response regulator
MADTPQVLLVCSSSKAHHDLIEAFKQQRMMATSVYTVRDAGHSLRDQPPALVICSSELLDGSYRDILQILQQAQLKVPVLVICGGVNADRAEYDEAKRLGAVGCLPRPLSFADLDAIIQTARREIAVAGKREPI